MLDFTLSGALQWCVTEQTLVEYRQVLSRPKFKFTKRQRDRIFDALDALKAVDLVLVVEPDFTLNVSPDEADNRFLECAEAADADYLVTGNKRHFPPRWERTTIVNPREFLTELAEFRGNHS